MISPQAIIALVLMGIVSFYTLSATYEPLEDAGLTLKASLGGAISGEVLGTCASDGNCVFYTDFTPIKSGSWTVYANGTAHTSWTNATVSVTLSTGEVNITATGTNPSTANAEITIDYQREPRISNISGISGLPEVAILLFILVTVLGLILIASGGRR